jgi:hypothetical protein
MVAAGSADHVTGGQGGLVIGSRIEAWAGGGVMEAGMLWAAGPEAVAGYLQGAFARGRRVWCG